MCSWKKSSIFAHFYQTKYIKSHKSMDISHRIIAVIGLGYVGLPLAVEYGKKYRVIGFDVKS